MGASRVFLLLTALVTQTACSTVTPGQWTGSRTFIGLVRIDMPVTAGDVQAVRVRTLGAAAAASGGMIGWQDGQWVIADPAACQMLVIIRSPAEIDNAVTVLRELRGQNLCLVDETAR